MSRRSRIGLVIGVAAIVALTAVIGAWALRTRYEVLFAGLSAQDAAALTRGLEQMKQPYRLADQGTTILVDEATVHATRLKLMDRDLPLHGTVGFELFNNSDFGMTEFAQKVNYQRALQGELTRTIASLAEVEAARVHLALPEDGLFKRDQRRAKAAITLTLRHGQSLRQEQVRGVQRLVAAAVPGIESRDVTIVGEGGVALTQDAEDSVAGTGSSRLELKREIELYLSRKANIVLDKTFGAGQALSSVDVTLDMNQLKVTTEDATAPGTAPGETPTGIVLRERETTRESNLPAGPDGSPTAQSTQREVDYQLGRRVEQIVSSPGAIAKLHVVTVVRLPLDEAQSAQLRQLVGSAVGAARERGDSVVVQSIHAFAAAAPAASPAPPTAAPGEASATPAAPSTGAVDALAGALQVAAVLVALAAAIALFVRVRSVRSARTVSAAPSNLVQCEASLDQVRAWLAASESLPAAPPRAPVSR